MYVYLSAQDKTTSRELDFRSMMALLRQKGLKRRRGVVTEL